MGIKGVIEPVIHKHIKPPQSIIPPYPLTIPLDINRPLHLPLIPAHKRLHRGHPPQLPIIMLYLLKGQLFGLIIDFPIDLFVLGESF
jgi:hypothetical protein